MTVLNDLVEFGFQNVTEWVVKGSKIGLASFMWQDHGGWVYAFVVDDEVKYIGLTNGVLRGRMSDYSHRSNPQTIWIRELIAGGLAAGRGAHVWGWKERDIDVLRREESRVRETYRPPGIDCDPRFDLVTSANDY